MTRQDLVKQIAETSGQSQTVVNQVLNGFIASVQDAVAAGNKVPLVGFGTFEAVARPERTGRNPATGEPMIISASTKPKFTAGKAFKDACNSK
jgi:DNA-binding protein HU-beta